MCYPCPRTDLLPFSPDRTPKGAGPLVKELVKDTTGEMKKEGLLVGKK
jgi:hypothetical protein